MKTITIANHKGGVAKTTTALNLSVILANQGSRVLVCDLDPQGNLSLSLGADLSDLEETRKTSHRLMLSDRDDYSTYMIKARPRLDLLPACLDHDAESMLLSQRVAGELLLKQKLAPAKRVYDFCVIDTPPSLQTPTLNALAMSDLVIIPIETSMFALHGISQLLRTIGQVRRIHAPQQVIMALSTLHNARQKLDRDVREHVVGKFGDEFVFNTTIPRLVAVGEATAQLQAVVESQPDSAATFAFHKLVKEVIEVLVDEGLLNEQEITRSNQR
jgi:chromosome partitioning protein